MRVNNLPKVATSESRVKRPNHYITKPHFLFWVNITYVHLVRPHYGHIKCTITTKLTFFELTEQPSSKQEFH